MTPLEKLLVERIKADGPIPLADYMAACNEHYYATRDPFGAAGDFVTAPEISQMYGEMLGAALAEAWVRAGRPEGACYAELGPGRGTLAADALRIMRAAGLDPAHIALVETSPLLRAAQASAVPGAIFHDDIAALADGDGPLFLVASEFFDALPVEQWVDGQQRRVDVLLGRLAFDRDGAIVERSPAREQAMAALSAALVRRGGVAIIIDYGHDRADALGDTLQAVRGHAHALPLEKPGEQDLTAHVDFAALGRVARAHGVAVSQCLGQGSFLESLGIGVRAVSLAAANPDRTADIAAARRRMCDEAEMGTMFKVMALAAPGWPMVAGLRQ